MSMYRPKMLASFALCVCFITLFTFRAQAQESANNVMLSTHLLCLPVKINDLGVVPGFWKSIRLPFLQGETIQTALNCGP